MVIITKNPQNSHVARHDALRLCGSLDEGVQLGLSGAQCDDLLRGAPALDDMGAPAAMTRPPLVDLRLDLSPAPSRCHCRPAAGWAGPARPGLA